MFTNNALETLTHLAECIKPVSTKGKIIRMLLVYEEGITFEIMKVKFNIPELALEKHLHDLYGCDIVRWNHKGYYIIRGKEIEAMLDYVY